MFNKNNTLFIELTNSCNLKCKSCGYWKPHKISNISVKEFQEILAFFESIGIKKLHLTGGCIWRVPTAGFAEQNGRNAKLNSR